METPLTDELIKRLVAGDTTASDRAVLVNVLGWLWEGADTRLTFDDPTAGPLFEVCDTIAHLLDKPTLTPDDGQTLAGSLEAAFALSSADRAGHRIAA